ncbi:MAG: cation diffusion facilitator family transporter [Roseburia sp.]|nr:cation diffusion facilitator family transporter [Roseburia sp.]MCM1279448.1 cation diffusion facilitator family transporter [Robinsoniella sp.]
MVSFFARLFIKNREDITSPNVRRKYGVLCGAVGIFFNVFLFGVKFLAGMLSHSIAITADAFNNLSDAGSSLITLIGFKLAGQKPDPGHPFGHGRFEYISGLLVSVAIILMAYELISSSIQKIIHPKAVASSPLVIAILLLSILIKLYMYFYNHSLGKKLNSPAMCATASDSFSDMIATSFVLFAILISKSTGLLIDGYCGVLVGLFIFIAGIRAAKDTINPLLGQPPSREFVKQIEEIVTSYDEILGIHDLIVHDYGPGRVMISLHAEVSAHGDLVSLHDIIDNIERTLKKGLKCDAVIHMDPVVEDDEETNQLKEQITAFLKEYDSDLNLHDFRLVKGPTHTNIIFDVLLPMEFKKTDLEVKQYLSDKIASLDPKYYSVIEIDRAYC